MIEKTLTIPESILKAENMSYDNSNSGLNATDTQAAIDEINQKSNIKVFAESPMTNTSDGVVKFNEIGGKMEQFTTSGAQLFDKSNATYVESLAFSPSNDSHYFASTDNNSRVYYVSVKPNTTYTISKELGTFFRVGTCEEIPIADGIVTKVNADTSKNVVTIATGDNDNYIAFYPLLVAEAPTIGYDAVIEKIMLNEGDTALPYEPYTGGIASPNPEYPQEIKKTVVAGVKTHGKNFIETYGTNAISSDYGAIATNVVANLKSGKTYTISADITASTATRAYWNMACGIFENSKHFDVSAGTNRYFYTFASILDGMPLPKAILSKSATGDGVEITVTNLMIEESTVATDYEPYQESTIEFSEPIALYGDPDAAVQDILNTKQVERNYDEAVFDGSETSWEESGIGTVNAFFAIKKTDVAIKDALCSHFVHCDSITTVNAQTGFSCTSSNYHYVRFRPLNPETWTLDSWKEWLSNNNVTITYKRTEPVIEPLPEVDQLALTQLKTFEGVTYVEFISDIQPTFKAESSTTQEGSYVLDLLARTTAVEKQVEALDDTLLYAQEDILDLEEAFHIPETTDTVLDGSYPGLLKVNEIGGKMEQFSTTGKNLVEPLLPTITSSKGVTCTNNGDGTFTLNGIATDVVTFRIDQDSISGTNNLKTYSGNYTISVRDSNGNVNPSGIELVLMQQDTYVIYLTSNGKATAEVNADKCFIYIYVANGTNLNNLKVYPQLEIGSEITSWEPYTGGQASPNPSYPMPINNSKVKGVRTHKKNLCKACELLATATNSYALVKAVMTIKKGLTYTISVDLTADAETQAYLNNNKRIFGSNHVFFNVSAGTKRYSHTFEAQSDALYSYNTVITKRATSDGILITPNNFMIEEGVVATDYEPYTESSYTFSEPIDLYGTDDVQDVITAKPIKRRFGVDVFNGSENWNASSFVGRYFVYNLGCKKGGAVLCSQAKRAVGSTEIVNTCYLPQSTDGRFVINTDFATLAEWKAHLAEKPMEVVYELAEETTEPLPAVDQIGLNNLLTYSDVTYVEFDCDGPQPAFKAEYPTSKENSYILESLLNTRTNALNQELINNKIAALEATIVSNI